MNLIEQLGGYEQAKVYSVDANACGAFDDALLTITKKFTHDGKPCIVFECTRTICDDFESEVRHAKPEELGAGHRI